MEACRACATGSGGDGMDEYEAKGPIHRLALEPGWGEHPGIGPLGLRNESMRDRN
jgi:hypothetical protein